MTTDSQLDSDAAPPDNAAGGDVGATSRAWRRIAAWAVTAGACALMVFALIAPNDINRYSLGAFLRIPVEGLAGLAAVLLLPARTRRPVVALLGVILGLLTVLKILDLGFFAVLYRPFDPVLDWAFIAAGVDYFAVTTGSVAAIAAVIGAVLLGLAVPVLMALAALRLSRIVINHRTAATRSAVALGIIWITCALLGAQLAPGLPVASTSTIDYAYLHAEQVPAGLRDQREFAAEVGIDAFRDTPGDRLLTSLRGKDVVLTFVESYGRIALEHPDLAPQIGALLDAGTGRLRAAGYESASGFLTSSTVGGGSWLAHATLLSGLWIDNQARYRNLVTTDRLTLNRAFQRAGWRTVGVEPAVIQAWPEGAFFGYDRIYAASDLGYRGPRFGYATMPDQYILSAFHRFECAPGHSPVMAQVVTLSGHAPWAPIPQLLDWNDVGDGSIYANTPNVPTAGQARSDYRTAVEYSLRSVLSYVETHGDDNLVMIFLGDHQPGPIVTGEGAGRDVPITIVTKDRAVLERISGWGWEPGLKPSPRAPVWPMNTFRDRFLTAFG